MRAANGLAVLLTTLCVGCGSSQALPVNPPVPVKGKISYRGKPLTKGQITLEPTDGGHEAQGQIQPDGSFVLTTFKEGDGALIGVHQVSVTGIDPPVKTKKPTHVKVSETQNDYLIDLK
jgi:hypothetical protein